MRNVRNNTKRTKKITTGVMQVRMMLILLVVLFCCYSALSVYQRSVLIKLDADINELEDQYRQAVKINDDLQGQMLHASNLAEVENYAVNVLGMIKPDNSSISYYAVAPTNTGQSAQTDGEATALLFGWINDLFK